MMEMRSNDVPELKAWLDKKRGNYIHSDIQNELLRIMAHRILREHVLKPIQNGSCISSNVPNILTYTFTIKKLKYFD